MHRVMSGWAPDVMGVPPSPEEIQRLQREAASQAQAQIHASATAKHVAEVTPGDDTAKRAAADSAYRLAYQTQLQRSRGAYGLNPGTGGALLLVAAVGVGAYFIFRKKRAR